MNKEWQQRFASFVINYEHEGVKYQDSVEAALGNVDIELLFLIDIYAREFARNEIDKILASSQIIEAREYITVDLLTLKFDISMKLLKQLGYSVSMSNGTVIRTMKHLTSVESKHDS